MMTGPRYRGPGRCVHCGMGPFYGWAMVNHLMRGTCELTNMMRAESRRISRAGRCYAGASFRRR